MTGTSDLLLRIVQVLADPRAEPAHVAAGFGPTTEENPYAVEPFDQVTRLEVSLGPEGTASSITVWLAPGSEVSVADLVARHGPAAQTGVAGAVQILAFHWSGPVRLYATLAVGGRGSREFTAERVW